MKTNKRKLEVMLSIGLLALGFSFAGCKVDLGGINSSASPSTRGATEGRDDGSVAIHGEEADSVGAEVLGVVMDTSDDLFSRSSTSSRLSLDGRSFKNQAKNQITVDQAPSCEEKDLPEVSGQYRETIRGNPDGSCEARGEMTESATEFHASAVMDCTHYKNEDSAEEEISIAEINGSLGFQLDGDESTLDFEISSKDLSLTLNNGKSCSAIFNIHAALEVDSAGNETLTMDGCLSVCGESFRMQGRETSSGEISSDNGETSGDEEFFGSADSSEYQGY